MNDIKISVHTITMRVLAEYAGIPISYEVRSALNVTLIDDGLRGMVFQKQTISRPYIKDYDNFDRPSHWMEKFETTNWRLLLARQNSNNVGGAILAYKTPGVYMLEDRDDLAVVWDIRVLPEDRHQGIGTMLFQKAIAWAREKQCTQLKVETQNVNVAACQFYVKQGCKLGGLNRHAYRGNPITRDEVQLLWYLDL